MYEFNIKEEKIYVIVEIIVMIMYFVRLFIVTSFYVV